MLQTQRLICRRLGIAEVDSDPETIELSQVTAIDNLAHEIEQKLPSEV